MEDLSPNLQSLTVRLEQQQVEAAFCFVMLPFRGVIQQLGGPV